jgi:hypothetical protein
MDGGWVLEKWQVIEHAVKGELFELLHDQSTRKSVSTKIVVKGISEPARIKFQYETTCFDYWTTYQSPCDKLTTQHGTIDHGSPKQAKQHLTSAID